PGWAADASYDTVAGRRAAAAELEPRIAEWTAPQQAVELTERLQRAGVAAALGANARRPFADPQLAHPAPFVRLEHAAMGETAYNAPSFRMSATPARMRPAPTI